MKAKQVWKTAVAVAIVLFSLIACSNVQEEQVELNIKQESNQLEQWKDKLPKSIQAGEIYAGAIRGIEIQKDGKDVFAASYEPREYKESFAYWDISVPYQSLVAVNTEELYQLFDTITMATWVEEPNVSLENAGIANSGTAVFIAYDAEQTQGELGAIEPTKAITILIGKEEESGNYYVAVDGSDKVYTVEQTIVNAILDIDPYQYILKIPVLVSQKAVAEVRIIGTKKNHVLKREDDKWFVDKKEMDDKTFQEYYANLMDLAITGEYTNGKEANDEREPVLTIQYDREDTAVSDVEIKFYPYNDTQMSVSVNGQENFLVDNESVEQLKEKIDNFE